MNHSERPLFVQVGCATVGRRHARPPMFCAQTPSDPRKPVPIGSLRLTREGRVTNQLAFVVTLVVLVAGLVIWGVI
jgi:hypothetical protein